MQSIKVAKKRGLASMMKPTERATIARYARRRFRNLVRLAFLNEYWIEPDGDDNELGDNVVKNVRMLTQGKKQKKAALTLRAKSIMNKKKENRTDEENLLIYKAVGNMKCFRKYPQHVKEQLSACTYFVYYAPGRVIVRQDDEGSSLFFILEGEVQVTQTRWDQALSEHTVVFSGVMESGAMFGEVSLLHGIKRLATVTAKEHCELLMIKKEDFDIVLKATVIDEWNAILEMMSKFTYFETWDDMLKRECCIMAKKGFFKYEDVILGEGIGEDKYLPRNIRHFFTIKIS